MGVPISQWCPNGSVMRPSRQRANTVAWIIDGIRDRADLRQGITRRHAIDQIWLLMDPAVYHHLTRYRGWSPATYEKCSPTPSPGYSSIDARAQGRPAPARDARYTR
jgi:hypothetical protein